MGEIVDNLIPPAVEPTEEPARTDGGTDPGEVPALPTDPVTDPVDERAGGLLETLTSGDDPLSQLLNGVVTTVVGPDGKLLK